MSRQVFPFILPLLVLTPVGCSFSHSRASTLQAPREISSPTLSRAMSPRVTATRDGAAVLTWLEPKGDTTAALRYSFWQNQAWTASGTVVADQPFSRHPSESPGIIALSEKNLIAYWSQRPPHQNAATNEVDVYFSISTDRGQRWTSPTLANTPGTGEESSYPSAAALDSTRASLIWLDGTNWKKEKRVSLMSRTVQSDGSASQATVVDPDTCTCCPTSLVHADSGLVAAYRAHTPANIRDISVLQNAQGRWSEPRVPHADNWHFAGCPVNGPNLDAEGSRVALVWFSAPQDQAEVKLAFSHDGGASFRSPVRIDEGNVVGRAQVVLLPGHASVVFWVEHKPDATRLLGRRVRDDNSLDPPFEITRGTGLGYPHATRAGDKVFVTWAEEAPVAQIHIAVMRTN